MFRYLSNNIIYLCTLCLTLWFQACTPDDQCRKESIVNMEITFYNDSTLKKASVDSITIYGVDNDSILYNNQKSVSSVALPLQKTKNETQYVFTNGKYTDTLTIQHTNSDNFISIECGCFVYHNITDVHSKKTWIDSIAVINPDVTTTNYEDEHLQIFMR